MSVSTSVQAAMKRIDDLGDPKFMTKVEWLDFLERICTECESRAEATREELKEDGG